MKKRILILASIFTILFAVSCEEDDICVGEGTPFMTVVLRNYTLNTKLADTLFVERLSPDMQTVETTLYDKVFTDSIKLPLGGLNESVSHFRIKRRTTGQADIITVNYNSKSNYVSKACGFRITYDNLNYQSTTNDIKAIESGESNILENESTTNLYIYYNSN